METSSQYIADDLSRVSQILEGDLAMESLNAQIQKDMQEIQTYIIPDSPTKETPEIVKKMEEEDSIYQSMNAELDKQIAQDMEAITHYINRADGDSISKRVEFFNNMDNSHINKCVNRTVSNHILVQHTVMGTLRWHECTFCDYKVDHIDKLREHITVKHGNSNMLMCPHCSFLAQRNDDLLKHLSVVHQVKAVELNCDMCSSRFKKDYDLLRHKKNEHGVKAFSCDKCDFITVEESEFGKHILMQHLKLNVSWYKCAHCVYRTAKKVNLDKHIMYKHSEF